MSPVIKQRKSLIVLALAIATVVACWLVPPANEGDEVGVIMNQPATVGDLVSFDEPVSQAERTILPPDTTFCKKSYGTYNDRLNRIYSSIVLSGREKRSLHRPERCLPGQGWSLLGSKIIHVPLKSGHSLAVTQLLLSRPIPLTNGTTRIMQAYCLYWYVGRNVSTPYSAVRVLLTNWDLIFHRKNQRWAYISIIGHVTQDLDPRGRGAEQTLALMKSFIRESVPDYMKSEMTPEQIAKATAETSTADNR